ncbi:MAG: hypothetical protein IJ397_00155 [Lachnospiraceae bacterium]|nr:hypothetical protein [Lachnospiraceae bacterium]
MKRKKKAGSVWSIFILIISLALAVFLPKAVFMVTDYRQLDRIQFANRETFEVLTKESDYPREVNARMNRLAGIGYGNITISKIAKSIDINEFNVLIAGVKNQTYMKCLEEMMPITFNSVSARMNATDLKTCDCYIVYGNDYEDGVILMFWYMIFDIPELGGRMELIVDSETETIYYIRLLSTQTPTYDAVSTEEVNLILNGKDFYNQQKIPGTEAASLLSVVSAEVASVADMFPSYFTDYYCRYYGIYFLSSLDYGGENLSYTEASFWENIAIGENVYTMAYALPYNNSAGNTIFFRFHMEINEETGTDVSIGIPIIRQFVQS